MPDSSSITLVPAAGPVRGTVQPPGSKSITNRALVCAALAEGESTLTGALDSEDTRVMIDSLQRLGIRVESREAGATLVVPGCGGKISASSADLFVGNSGTTIRFLTALCALGHGTYRLDGVERMRQRPIGDLLDALQELGAKCRGQQESGFPPVIVEAKGLAGGEVRISGGISSQFLSGLLLAAPYAAANVDIIVVGQLVSVPYVVMTLKIMETFGVHVVEGTNHSRFEISAPQKYAAQTYAIEPDASAASYFWAAAAVTGGEVTVAGLGRDSLQGDVAFVGCLERMGCHVTFGDNGITVSGRAEHGIEVDMNAISDTVQTLAAVALFAKGPTAIVGVGHIRHKETDRIGDLARELRKFGATVDELPHGLKITPPSDIRQRRDITIETYNDHRMAMSLALPGLVLPGISIQNPGCTAKTYPRFFDDLAALTGSSR